MSEIDAAPMPSREERLWDELIGVLPSGSELHKAVFAKLYGSPEPFEAAISILAALNSDDLRHRSQRTLRTWAIRESARQEKKAESHQKIAHEQEKIRAKREQEENKAARQELERQAQRKHEIVCLKLTAIKKQAVSAKKNKKRVVPRSDELPKDDQQGDGVTSGKRRAVRVRRMCEHASGCTKRTRGGKKLCAAHAGGRKCQFVGGCERNVDVGGELCSGHKAGKTKCVHESDCEKFARRDDTVCHIHGARPKCQYEDCEKLPQRKGLCCAHGGWNKCNVESCEKRSIVKGVCMAHGEGVKCKFPGGLCENNVAGGKLCVEHGGRKCAHPSGNCTRQAKSKGLCTAHGGRPTCKFPGGLCEKQSQYHGLCRAHGGGRICSIANCDKYTENRTLLCRAHNGSFPRNGGYFGSG